MINLFLITFLACGDDEETDTSKLEVENPQEEVVEESTEEVEGEEVAFRREGMLACWRHCDFLEGYAALGQDRGLIC